MKQLLSEAVDEYLAHRASQDLSKRTLKNEAVTFRQFLTVTGNIYCHNIESRHVTAFFTEGAKTRQASSLANDHAKLNSFFAWCRHTRRIGRDEDPMHGRRMPKKRERERYRVHVSKFPHLLDIAGDRDARDRALVAVLLYTLLRDREAATLRIGDVDLDAGYIMVKVYKSHKADRMPISAELDQELRTWLTHYTNALGAPLEQSYFLLPSRKAISINRNTEGRFESRDCEYVPTRPVGPAWTFVKPVLEAIGVPLLDNEGNSTHEGAHTLRRSGARALFDRLNSIGYDQSLRVVQAMLHHSSTVQTEAYIGISADRRTRDDLIRGQSMYAPAREGVLSLARVASGDSS